MSRTKVRWSSIEGLRNYTLRGGKANSRHKIVMHMHDNSTEASVHTRRSLSVALDVPVNEISGRVNDLIKDGVILEAADPVSCPVTGNTVHRLLWNPEHTGQY